MSSDFYRQFHYQLFSYGSHMIPEISDEFIVWMMQCGRGLAGRLALLKPGTCLAFQKRPIKWKLQDILLLAG